MARKTEQRSPDAYLDTSAFIAFLDRSDSYHLEFTRLFSKPPRLCTSALVIAEGHGWFLRRYDRKRAMDFLAFVDVLPKLTIRQFDEADLAKARQVLKRFADQNLTLADAHGLSIMKNLRAAECWSTDRHLTLLGAKLVIRK